MMPKLSFTSLANPNRFMQLSSALLPFLSGATIAALLLGLWLSLFVAPDDYQQGASVKIMFLHVPFAWLSLGIYTFMTLAALGTLIFRHPLADVAAKSAAPIGAIFAFLCLVTGSLWGKPMWGAWWVWDARLTSMLILFLIYLGIAALYASFDDPLRGARVTAVLILSGFINIPIVKFSVDWWNTLHQPASVVRFARPAIDPSLLIPLLVMALAFALLFVLLLLLRMRSEIWRRRIATLQIKRAYRSSHA